MSTIDAFITQHAASHFRAGETPLGYGLVLRQPRRNKIDSYLAAATDQRLLLFASDYKIGFSVSAVAKAGAVTEWTYHDLAEVKLGTGAAMMGGHAMVELVPHPGRGPSGHEPPQRQRWVLQIPTKVKNLGYHAEFHRSFPSWLHRQVAAGAFASPAPAASPSASPTVEPSGARAVLIAWSDGQRYPATLLAVQGQQGQVQFPDGRTMMIDMAHVSA